MIEQIEMSRFIWLDSCIHIAEITNRNCLDFPNPAGPMVLSIVCNYL